MNLNPAEYTHALSRMCDITPLTRTRLHASVYVASFVFFLRDPRWHEKLRAVVRAGRLTDKHPTKFAGKSTIRDECEERDDRSSRLNTLTLRV